MEFIPHRPQGDLMSEDKTRLEQFEYDAGEDSVSESKKCRGYGRIVETDISFEDLKSILEAERENIVTLDLIFKNENIHACNMLPIFELDGDVIRFSKSLHTAKYHGERYRVEIEIRVM